MSTKIYYFSGLIKWAKRSKDDKYQNYTVNLYPDEKSLAAIAESGVQIGQKKDEDGAFYTFRRPEEKQIKNDMVHFGPPAFLIMKDGKAVEYDGIVGNGSKGQIKVSVFDVPRTGGKGHRYEAVLVEDLVEYVPPETADAALAGIPGGGTGGAKAISPNVPF